MRRHEGALRNDLEADRDARAGLQREGTRFRNDLNGEVRTILRSRQPMLRRQQSRQLNSRVLHRIDISTPVPIQARLICDQPDPLAFQGREFILFPNVQPS